MSRTSADVLLSLPRRNENKWADDTPSLNTYSEWTAVVFMSIIQLQQRHLLSELDHTVPRLLRCWEASIICIQSKDYIDYNAVK